MLTTNATKGFKSGLDAGILGIPFASASALGFCKNAEISSAVSIVPTKSGASDVPSPFAPWQSKHLYPAYRALPFATSAAVSASSGLFCTRPTALNEAQMKQTHSRQNN